jgi:Fe-S-cluster containining protein
VSAAVEQLCPQCGLCCNGVLFSDVELQRSDKADRLAALGLELLAKGRKRAFSQPCACFDGKLCRIYADRPARCHAFECTQIQRVEVGKQSLAAAARTVRETRRLAEEVTQLCRELGNHDEHIPLNRRYSAVMAEPFELDGDEKQLNLRGELMLAVGRLVDVLERDFLFKEATD